MSPIYRIGSFEVRTGERRLFAHGGVPVPLGARAFDVLVALVEQRDRVVGKQELLDAAWPGLVVEENNLSVQVSALRKILGAPAIVTVAGRGYRLAAEVRVQPLPGVEPRTAAAASVAPSADRPVIAVLPLAVLSTHPGDALLADGLVADVISLLARTPGFLLISRASSIALRDCKPAQVAAELGARYVVEGDLRAGADGVRVSTQLVEGASGHVLWAGTFHSAREAVDDLQDGIARGILSLLQPELTRAEIALVRRQRPDNQDAWSHYHQAVGSIANHGWNEASVSRARSELKQAMAADPSFGLAHAYYAVLTAIGHKIGMVTDPGCTSELLPIIDRALRLDGNSAEVVGYAGCALSDLGHIDRAVDVLRAALELDPSNAQAQVALGGALLQQGHAAEGIDRMRLGMRISPRDRRLGFWGWMVALFLLRDGRPEEALAEARLSESRDANLHLARIAEAVALARLGRADEAVKPLVRAMQLRPVLTLAEISLTHGRRAGKELADVWRLATAAT